MLEYKILDCFANARNDVIGECLTHFTSLRDNRKIVVAIQRNHVLEK